MAEATRWWAAAFAGCVIGLAAVGGSVVVALREDSSPVASAGWQRLPDSPLGPRSEVVGVWTGEEVLFVGGTTYACSPAADCGGPIGPYFADGAALDPDTGEWRTIAQAPIAFAFAVTAVVYSGSMKPSTVKRAAPSPGCTESMAWPPTMSSTGEEHPPSSVLDQICHVCPKAISGRMSTPSQRP